MFLFKQKTSALSNKNWYAVGDSITYPKIYQKHVKKKCSMKYVKTDAIRGQLLKTMTDRITPIALEDFDIITIQCVTNDFKRTPIGDIECQTQDTFYGALYTTIKKILNCKSDIKLAFIITHQVGTNKYFPEHGNPNELGLYQADYNEAVIKMCNKFNIPYLDLYEISGIDLSNFNIYTKDNVHLNRKGYKECYVDKIIKFLESIVTQ